MVAPIINLVGIDKRKVEAPFVFMLQYQPPTPREREKKRGDRKMRSYCGKHERILKMKGKAHPYILYKLIKDW
jgi:hypothetical protein